MEKNGGNSTIRDMTSGSPVKLIIQFMIPMFLGNIFQQFYNIADSIVAGQFLGVRALAAIGSTGSLMFFVTGWLNGLSSGFAIIVAQMFGAKKFDRMRHYVAMSIYLMAAFSIVMTIGFSLANKPILHLMNSPEEVFGDVTAYMGIIYAGLIITGAYNALAAFLRALGDSKSPLYFLIISAVINVILDVVFIVVFGMGVEGCGYATVIAQGISAVCCLIYIVKRFPILHLERKDFEICWDSFGRLLKLGIPMGLQFSITAIGTIIVQSAVNIYGPVHMAGFSAAGKIQNIFATVFTAFGATIATYVGQNRGAGKMDRVKQGVRYTQMMVLGWSVFVMFLMFFFGKYLTYLFVDPSEQDVVNVSVTYFRTVFWAYPFLCTIFVFRNALQGMGYGMVPMLGGVFELVARTLIVTLLSLAANAILAFIVSRKRFLFQREVSLFWVITMYVNGGMIPTFLLYKGLGLTNNFWVYVIPGMVSAFNMLVIRTYMNGIPDSLEESAQLDGAGYSTIFLKIYSPLCKPVYATVALFVAVGQWNSWFDAMLYNRMSSNLTTLQYELMKLLSSVTNQGTSAEAMKNAAGTVTPTSVRAAATIITMLPIICIYPFLQKYFVAGLTLGGVKE